MYSALRLHVFSLVALLLFSLGAAVHAADAPPGRELIILHTKDLHARFVDKNERHKNLAALMSAYFTKAKADNARVLALDTGNFSPNYQYAKVVDRNTVVTLMGKMGYDALNIGSHELDEGFTRFRDMVEASTVALLSANLEFTSPDSVSAKVKPYIIKDMQGLKVGVIGFVGSDYATNYITDENFRIINPNENGRLNKLVQKLNSEVDVIIILANGSMDSILKATETLSGSNIVVLVGWGAANGTDYFKSLHKTERANSPLFMFTHSDDINRLRLIVNNKEIKSHSVEPVNIARLSEEDEAIAKETSALIEKRKRYYEQHVGVIVNDIDARRKTLSNMPTNAVSLLAQPIKEKWKEVECVIINSGAIYSYQNDLIEAGNISIGALSKLYPFMNTVVIAKLSGRDIKSMLERSSSAATFSDVSKSFDSHQMRSFLQTSGLQYTLDFSNTSQVLSEDDKKIIREGTRVRNITINGKPLDPDKYYTVATNDYVFGGGDGFVQFKNAKDIVKTGIEIQELMQDYLKRRSPVTLDAPDYVIFLNRKESDYQQVGDPFN